MSKICTVLVPTRQRPDILSRCLDSIIASADPANCDIIVRVDYDDGPTLNLLTSHQEWLSTNVKVIIGPRCPGAVFTDLWCDSASLADSDWVWFFNDDCMIQGKGWDTQLKNIPTTGYVVWTEHNKTGNSSYGSAYQLEEVKAAMADPPQYKPTTTPHFTTPIVPNRCWYPGFGRRIPQFIDQNLDLLLRQQMGWRVKLLNSITVHHLFVETRSDIYPEKI